MDAGRSGEKKVLHMGKALQIVASLRFDPVETFSGLFKNGIFRAVDEISIVAQTANETVPTCPSIQDIVTTSTINRVTTAATVEPVRGFVSRDTVRERIAETRDFAAAREPEILHIIRESMVSRGNYGIDSSSSQCQIADIVHEEQIVPLTPKQDVNSLATI